MAAFYSNSWYLVAELIIQLRPHLQVARHVYRGKIWYVIYDKLSGQSHRLSEPAYAFIGLLDGERNVHCCWQQASETLDEEMPSQDEIVRLLSQLFRANVLQANQQPDIQELYRLQNDMRRKKIIQQLKSPLGIKIPLLDPDAFLNRTQGWVMPLFSRTFGFIWLLAVGCALVLAGIHWDSLSHNLSDRVLSVNNLLLLLLVYPLVKTCHELGHAYAVKRWGGEVHEIGVMLLVFIPVPYVDASAASVFSSKYQRMLVGAVGILVELFIAALAMLVWTLVEPGLVRSLAFNTLLIAGVSSLFFNGNPLLRFDAYYVFADWLEIPNLASRANKQVGYICKRYLLGIRSTEGQASISSGESLLLVIYSCAAFIYRMIIMVVIALFVAGEYFFIGVLLALWSLYIGLMAPIFSLLRQLLSDFQLRQKKLLLSTWLLLAAGSVVALTAVIPLPYSTVVQGALLPGETSQVRAQQAGLVSRLLVADGQQVGGGQPLLKLDNPVLHARLLERRAAEKVALAEFQASINNRNDLEIKREILKFTQQDLQQLQQQVADLNTLSPAPGVFMLRDGGNLVGRYVQRGEVLGHVLYFAQLPVTAMVPEEAIDTVINRTEHIRVRMVSDWTQSYSAHLQRFHPSSSRVIPSQIFATEGGGPMVVDPQSGAQGQALQAYFKLELALEARAPKRLNERILVRFHHYPEPLMFRLMRSVRRLFLRQLDV